MKPFSLYFHGPSRPSMEPLMKEKDDSDIYSRSASPASVSSTASTGLGVRRQRFFAVLVAAAVGGLFIYGWHLTSRHLDTKLHTFDITLRLQEEPYVAIKDGQRVFDWRENAFLPPATPIHKQAAQKVKSLVGYQPTISAPVKHDITVRPKTVNLDGLPDHVRSDEIVFGFTSPYRRAREMCSTWKHFLQHGSHCLVLLPKEEIVYKREMEFYLQQEGLDCKVETIDLGQYPRYEHRVMSLPSRMYAHEWYNKQGDKVQPKWFIVADDDTQILDMRVLQREVSQRIHTEDNLLCAVTESQQQLGRHGRICYGGGGIVMSASLAEKMATRIGECLWWHHWRFGGDEMLTHCASTVLSTAENNVAPAKTFEEVVGLHQIDIPGDGSGVFQSGLPFISIHHYTGWLEVFPLWHAPDRFDALRRLQKAVNFLGGDNIFKRYVFDDGSTFLSLGYSITLYSQPLKKYEMRLMERTYRSNEHELRWPARPMIPEGKTKGRYKTTYFLLDVVEEEKLMIYQNRKGDKINVRLQS